MFDDISDDISIHAPTRGATDNVLKLNAELKFQSTLPREERRLSSFTGSPVVHISIHAPTRGATAVIRHLIGFHWHFNPRSHERSDGRTKQWVVDDSLFQSTLPREERPLMGSIVHSKMNFNPRSHERSDAIWDSCRP